MSAGGEILAFEREICSRLILAWRKLLPDITGTPERLMCLRQSQDCLGNIVIRMVSRGDFDAAVSNLTAVLYTIGVDFKFDFSNISDHKTLLGIDSLLIVLESLLAAFTELMINFNTLPPESICRVNPNFHSLLGVYHWASIREVPALDPKIASELLQFVKRVMPITRSGYILIDSLDITPEAKLINLLLSTAQFIYISNPAIVQDAMAQTLIEWDPPARKELLLLDNQTSGSVIAYLKLVRAYLPRLDADDQLILLHKVYVCLVRGLISDPNCIKARSLEVDNALASLSAAVDRTRAFKSLRAFRAYDSLVITTIELIRKMAKARTLQERRIAVSVTSMRLFERATTTLKKEASSDRRNASQLAAICYFINIGFYCGLISDRPDGEVYMIPSLEVAPYVASMLDAYDELPESVGLQLIAYCLLIKHPKLPSLATKATFKVILKIIQLVLLVNDQTHLRSAIQVFSSNIASDFRKAVKNRDLDSIYAGLCMLSRVDESTIPLWLLRTVLTHTVSFIASTDLDDYSFEILMLYTTRMVQRTPDAVTIEVLLPLVPEVAPVKLMRNPCITRRIHLFLSLLAGTRTVIPEWVYQEGEILHTRASQLRIDLFVALCSDSLKIVESSLKSLELLQNDPYQSPCERELSIEAIDSTDNPMLAVKALQKRMADIAISETDDSLIKLSSALRSALRSLKRDRLSSTIASNLLELRVASLPLESVEDRKLFYSELMLMDGILLHTVSTSAQVSATLASEFLRTNMAHKQCAETLPDERRVVGKSQVYTWLLKSLAGDHPISAEELGLGALCYYSLSHLETGAPLAFIKSVLQFVETSAKYANAENVDTSKIFDPVVDLILQRDWNEACGTQLGCTLCALFEKFRVTDVGRLTQLCRRVVELDVGAFQAHPVTRLLHENYNFAVAINSRKLSDNLSGNPSCRSHGYEALVEKFSESRPIYDGGVDSNDFVSYLLENKPVLVALCDVCSVNGDGTIAQAIIHLFKYSSLTEQAQLLATAVAHEVDQSSSVHELFRGNTVTMGIIIEWLRRKLTGYLAAVLVPTLSTLRTAVISDNIDLEPLYEKGLKRFKMRELPPIVRWLITLIRRYTATKFDLETADKTVCFVVILRIICPAIISPTAFQVINRQPTNRFSSSLRKYAGYIQRNKGKLYQYIQDCNNFDNFDDVDDVHHFTESTTESLQNPAVPASIEQDFMISSRLVFHLLRRYSVEVRVILLSRHNGQYITNMFRFLRLGKDEIPFPHVNSTPAQGQKLLEVAQFRGIDVISEKARNIATGQETFFQEIFSPASKNYPFVIDFTDYTLNVDQRVESLAHITHSIADRAKELCIIFAINCPRRTKLYMSRLQAITSIDGINIEYMTSLDLVHEAEGIPNNLSDVKTAVEDIKGAVRFPVQATVGRSINEIDLEMYIGARYIQFVGDGTCDVIPYVSPNADPSYMLSIILVKNELRISAGGSEFVVLNPTASLLRVLELSLVAVKVSDTEALLDIDGLKSLRVSQKSIDSNGSSSKSGTPSSCISMSSVTDTPVSEEFTDMIKVPDTPAPGTLIFWALVDLFDDSESVRTSALELFAMLPETWGIQLNIPSSQQKVPITQINNLAVAAAKAHPELAFDVLCALASLGTKIDRVAAKVAAPWVSQMSMQSFDQQAFIDEVLRPLLKATSENPTNVSLVLLEYFWPHLRVNTQIMANLLIDAMSEASADAIDALRQIPASTITVNRLSGSQEFVQKFLDRLYTCFAIPGDMSSTKWSQHPKWSEIKSAVILFSSTPVDSKLAESLSCDVGIIVLMLAGVGPPQLRTAIHQLLLTHMNALSQAPRVTQFQRQRFLLSRSELTSHRGCEVFGVLPAQNDTILDDYRAVSPEKFEYLGRILTEIALGIYCNRLAEFQEIRVAIASRIKEYTNLSFTPMKRRSVLGLIGSVRMFMPGNVVAELIRGLARIISEDGKNILEPKGVLISAYLRMFSETVECIPDAGIYPRYLFWVAMALLACGCKKIQSNAVRLLRECVKIEHYRGSFKTTKMPALYLKSQPNWVDEIRDRLPFNLPCNENSFHVALAAALVPVILNSESRTLALKCCEVLATASNGEYPYTCFLYVCGGEERVIPHVPIFDCFDTTDGLVRWLASNVKVSNPSTIVTLALCAQISGFITDNSFPEVSNRLLNLIQLVPDRRIVTMISPLLMRTFSNMMSYNGPDVDQSIRGLGKWTLSILSQNVEERSRIAEDFAYLYDLVQTMDLTPWFSESSDLLPLLQEPGFTESTAFALGSDLNLWEGISFEDDLNTGKEELF